VLEREFNRRYWGRPVTLQAVRRWMRGEAIPAQDKLQVLAEWLKVEPQVLRFGEEAVHAAQSTRQRWEGLNYAERETLDAFLRLPPEQRKVVQQVIGASSIAYGRASKTSRISGACRPFLAQV